METKTKVVVIGAGNVGATIAYTLTVQHAASEIVIIDVAKDKAIGEVDDIKHGLCFLGEANIYAGDYSDVKGADLIVMTAGAGRKPGETRLDLANKNVSIAKSCTTEIMKHYDGGAILVVANPVDILTYMVAKWTGLPSGRVFGSGTSLDSVRFRSILSDLTDIDVANVHGYILGEHGDSQFAAWSHTHVAGMPIDSYCKKENITLDAAAKADIEERVKKSGANIISRKGATFYGVSACVASLTNSVLHNRSTIRTVGTVLTGQFGIDGIALSLPSVVYGGGVKDVLTPELTEEELNALRRSADACRAVLDQVKDA